ncbi:hypothetical protein J6590_028752 [Homalodisca vitripennis]|nr:hypothetical protein J6590_028752 [Homalodisca vitripennis]
MSLFLRSLITRPPVENSLSDGPEVAGVTGEFKFTVFDSPITKRNRCWSGKWGYCVSTLHSWGHQRRRSCCPATNLRAALSLPLLSAHSAMLDFSRRLH